MMGKSFWRRRLIEHLDQLADNLMKVRAMLTHDG